VAIERLPEDVRTRAVARAAFGPAAVVATGAGVGLGLLVGGVVPAVILGAGFWAVRVGVAALAGRRRRLAAQPKPIDPYAVPEPWRTFVREAVTAQDKFDQAVATEQPGPLQDRMREVALRVDHAARECFRVAQLGATIAATLASLDPAAASRQLREVQEQRRASGAASGPASGAASGAPLEALDQSEAALAARLQAAHRMEGVVQRATDQLRILTAELDQAVTSAVELSLDANDPAAALPVADNVDSVVGEIEALRRAMEETEGTPMTGTSPTS
jgi:hypothetical protein